MNFNFADKQQRHRVLFLVIVVALLGIILRFQAISLTVVDNPIRADARVYYFAALNLERWSVFSRAEPGDSPPKPDAFVQPGLPYFMAPLVDFPPTERMLFHINMVQAILGGLTILLTFAFFSMFTNHAIALGAALLTAISPHLVVMTTYLLSETLFTFLLMSSMFVLAYALRKGGCRWAIVAGCLFGLTALTRATTEYLPLLLLASLYWATDRRTFLRVALPVAVAAVAVIVAWKLRNLMAIGALSDPSLMISTLHHGMYPDFMFNDIPVSRGIPYRFDPFTQQASGLGAVLSEIQHRATENPLRYAYWYLIGKPIALLSWDMVDGFGDIFIYPISASPYLQHTLFQSTRLIALLLHAPLSIAAVAGCLFTLFKPGLLGLTDENRLPAILVAILIGYFFAIHIIGAPFPRYGIPLRPIVYGFGLFSIIALLKNIMSFRIRQQNP